MTNIIERIAAATNMGTQEVAAWINGDADYNLDAIDQEIRNHLNDGDEHPLNTLHNRGILTAEEVADLND